MDLADFEDADLDALRVAVLTEQERRQTLATAEEQAHHLASRYATAIGRQDGDPWEQPTGAHNAYSAGAVVEHGGKTWESLTPANVWEPGISGWREVVEDGGVPEWVAPTGAHDAYQTGDRVTYDGQVYESVINGNTWSPADYPQGWKAVD